MAPDNAALQALHVRDSRVSLRRSEREAGVCSAIARKFRRFRQGLPNKVQKRAVSDSPNDAPRSGTAAPRLRVQSQHKQKGRCNAALVMHSSHLDFSCDSPRKSTDDDLHPTILRLAHTWTSRHQEARVAEALNGDRIRRHTVRDQLRLDSLGASDRQALVVLRCARGIGIAVHLDPRVLHLGGVGRRFPDDLARTIGEVVLSQSKNTRYDRDGAAAGTGAGAAGGGGGGWPKL